MASDKISVYLCGAHGVGKTTLQQALQQNVEFTSFNFKTQEEIARVWVKQKGYTQDDLRRPDSFFKLQKELLALQTSKEENEIADYNGKYCRFLWDRGVIDPIIYAKEFFGRQGVESCLNIPNVKKMLERWQKGDEILVVVLKPERDFNVADGTRLESNWEEIEKIHYSMLETLEELQIPHKVIDVFQLSERVQMVVEEVKKKWPWLTE